MNEFRRLTVLTVITLLVVTILYLSFDYNSYINRATQIVKANPGNYVYYVNQQSNVDGVADVGSHSNFTALQYGPDSIYDTLTEADDGTGSPLTITFRAVGTKASGTTSAVSVPLPTGVQVNDLLILVATTIAGGSVSITATGGMTWTAVNGTPVDVTNGEKLYAWWARYVSGGTAPSVRAASDHVCAGIVAYYNVILNGCPIEVYETGTETTSDTSFSFSTTVSTQGPNRMIIVICTSGADTNTAQFSAWANSQLSGVTERADYMTNSGGGGGFGLAQGMKSSAGAIGTWTATLATATPKAYVTFALKPALSPNYVLDLEAQWTNVVYTEENEYLCIYVGTLNSESLRVDVWTGSSWVTVISALNSGWNNVSVSDYLTSSTFTIRFKDTTQTDDTSQSSWQIDCALLHVWTVEGYNLCLRVMDYDLSDAISGAYVYKDSDVKVSDANGWANWTLVSGTVTIKVSYCGYWVNGSFTVVMDGNKVINVRCNLYDVVVNVRENIRNAKLSNVKVSVRNSSDYEIKFGFTDNNGYVGLTNLPNATLTFKLYGGSDYSILIGTDDELISYDDYSFSIIANQNYVSTSSGYSIIVYVP